MNTSSRAPGYDLFKLIVAIILLVLFLFLIRQPGRQTAIPPSEGPTFAVLPPTSTILSTPSSALPSSTPTPSPTTESTLASPPVTLAISTPTVQASSTPTGTMPSEPSLTLPSTALRASPTRAVSVISSPQSTSTAAPSTSTSTATSSPAQTITPLATSTLAISSTPLPSPGVTPVIETTATPMAEAPSVTEICEVVTARSQLQVGANATILRRLNFRTSPGIRNNWILTNISGTPVEIVGGPECVPHLWGAYLWWQIKLPDGRVGWSAEGSLFGSFYFMEPAE